MKGPIVESEYRNRRVRSFSRDEIIVYKHNYEEYRNI